MYGRRNTLGTLTLGLGMMVTILVGACRDFDADDESDQGSGALRAAGAPAAPGGPGGPGRPPDAGAPPDAGGSCDSLPATYNNLNDTSLWQTFDTTSLDPAARGYTGVSYDGHYVYLVPYDTDTRSGIVARYDRNATFTSAASWKTFDLSSIDSAAKGFFGSSFDGRYVYLAQFNSGTEYGGRVARLDTTSTFDSASAWTIFDASTVSATSKGFAGTIYDGRYVYFLPYYNDGYDGVVTRYDTQASFTSPAAWTTFDLATKDPKARGFVGGVFDGRYLYLTPFSTETGYSSTFARYDTQAAFGSATSWSTFDTTTIDANTTGYKGAVFDGRYVYYFPQYRYLDGPHGAIVRFDTNAAFTSSSAWSTFDIATVDPAARGFIGGVFDGRYVTLIPSWKGTPKYTDRGTVARYDTKKNFGSTTSWSTFDLTTLTPNARGFHSGGFDGRYIYMTEYWDGTSGNGLVVRFDAKSTPCGSGIPSSYLPNLTAGVANFL